MLSRAAFGLVLQRRRTCFIRTYSESAKPKEASKEKGDSEKILSSCPENTVLTGLNYLKDQPPVVARADSEYPEWLWALVKPKNIPHDGPGGRGEKMTMRKANKKRIKEQNFLKTQ